MATREYREHDKTGLSRFSTWLVDPLPRNISPTDLDMVIHDGATNRLLVVEFKRPGNPITKGQSILLDALVNDKPDVTTKVVTDDPRNGEWLNRYVHNWFRNKD